MTVFIPERRQVNLCLKPEGFGYSKEPPVFVWRKPRDSHVFHRRFLAVRQAGALLLIINKGAVESIHWVVGILPTLGVSQFMGYQKGKRV